MLAILTREHEPVVESSCSDQRIERLQSGGFGMRLHQVVCAPGDISSRRTLLVCRDHYVEIVRFALAAGAGDQFKRRDRGEQALLTEVVQVVGGFGISAREGPP